MLYNVSQLLMEPTGSTRRFPLDEPMAVPEDAPEGSASGKATGMVRLLRTHHGLLVNATVDVQVTTTCARCLVPCDRLSTLAVEEECYPTVDPATGRNMSPPDEAEGVVHIDTRQMLDLSDVLRQYLLTDEPLKTLCRNDCQGLCPECGADLNMEKCKCAEPAIDPRWGVLSALIPERAEGSEHRQ